MVVLKHHRIRESLIPILGMKLEPLTGHKPGQIPSKKYFSTIFRTGILRSFFWEGSQFARKPGLWQKLETTKTKTKKNKKNEKFDEIGQKLVSGALD